MCGSSEGGIGSRRQRSSQMLQQARPPRPAPSTTPPPTWLVAPPSVVQAQGGGRMASVKQLHSQPPAGEAAKPALGTGHEQPTPGQELLAAEPAPQQAPLPSSGQQQVSAEAAQAGQQPPPSAGPAQQPPLGQPLAPAAQHQPSVSSSGAGGRSAQAAAAHASAAAAAAAARGATSPSAATTSASPSGSFGGMELGVGKAGPARGHAQHGQPAPLTWQEAWDKTSAGGLMNTVSGFLLTAISNQGVEIRTRVLKVEPGGWNLERAA